MHNQRKPFFLGNHCSLPPNASVCVYSLFFSHHHPSDLCSFFIPLAPLSCHSGTTEWDKEPKQPHLPPASRSALRVPKPCAHHAQGTGGGGVGWGRRGSGLNVRGATAGQGIQVSNRISQASPFIIIISPLFFFITIHGTSVKYKGLLNHYRWSQSLYQVVTELLLPGLQHKAHSVQKHSWCSLVQADKQEMALILLLAPLWLLECIQPSSCRICLSYCGLCLFYIKFSKHVL